VNSSAVADAVLIWDPSLLRYDFGARHPLAPVRVELAVALMRACGLLDAGVDGRPRVVAPRSYAPDELLRRHDPAYIDAVRRLSANPDGRGAAQFGLGIGDTPVFEGAHAAALNVCAATATAADLVMSGEARHAFNPAGGLHHAMPSRAAGFCVYNDLAAGIDQLLDRGAERVVYIDIDVHHGDGVERMFAHDPRVMTISIHESGHHLFPGTGHINDVGARDVAGSVINLPLHPSTAGEVWLDVFDRIADPLVRAFEPDVLVTQLGCDAHHEDPLAHLSLTIDDFAQIYRRLHALAHDVTAGKWVATGGGGYALARVVPRAWTLAYAEMSGAVMPVETPMTWRELVAERGLGRPPDDFTDDLVTQTAAMRADTERAAQATIDAARRAYFPRHGLE